MSRICGEVLREVDEVIGGLLRRYAASRLVRALLDVGCWDGSKTVTWAGMVGRPATFGVEVFLEQASAARARGIEVFVGDLERDRFPWADESMDVIICNQVFEHLKNIWLPMSEIARVLKKHGCLIFSVPNLASLHNRLFLLFGAQPTSVRVFGPHVRGFTGREAKRFLEYGGILKVRKAVGVGFYPLPARWARIPARVWAGAAHTVVFLAEKRSHCCANSESPWLSYARGPVQTSWFGG